MGEITTSTWFALLTGLASVLGFLITLYQLRVQYRPYSRLRSMEWEKNILISSGIGIMVFSSIQFYNQSPPPRPIGLRNLYDYLHGDEGAVWNECSIQFLLPTGTRYLNVQINQLELTPENTILKFRAWPNDDGLILLGRISPSNENDNANFARSLTKNDNWNGPLNTSIDRNIHSSKSRSLRGKQTLSLTEAASPPSSEAMTQITDSLDNIIIGTSSNVSFSLRYKTFAIDKYDVVIGDLVFPSLLNLRGNLLVWGDTEYYRSRPSILFNDKRGSGIIVWALLFPFGGCIFALGLLYSPFLIFRVKLLLESRSLHGLQDYELKRILKKRNYDELPTEDKHRYDRTKEFYTRLEQGIFDMQTGRSPKPSPTDTTD